MKNAPKLTAPGVSVGPSEPRNRATLKILLVGGSPSWRKAQADMATQLGCAVEMAPRPARAKSAAKKGRRSC